MEKTVLLIATLDTKEEEAFFLKQCIESHGLRVMVMDTGILSAPQRNAQISQNEVANRGGCHWRKSWQLEIKENAP